MRQLLTLTSTLIAAAALAAGCTPDVRFADDDGGGSGQCTDPAPGSSGSCPAIWTCIDGQWVDTGGACPDVCPREQPANGSACSSNGQSCTYEEYVPGMCGEDDYYEVTVTCVEGKWSTTANYCSPPPECPDSLPVVGGDCSGWYDAWGCGYTVETACGSDYVEVYCDGNSWQLSIGTSCQQDCAELTTAESCSVNQACQWLVPGCGDPVLPQAGCFPADGCGTGCGDGEACATVWHDPCWNSLCNACGAEIDVCLPAPTN